MYLCCYWKTCGNELGAFCKNDYAKNILKVQYILGLLFSYKNNLKLWAKTLN